MECLQYSRHFAKSFMVALLVCCFPSEGKSIIKNINFSFQLLPLSYIELSKAILGASLVAQWLRICLPMQGTRVRALVWEDPTCRGATRPVSNNY